MNKILFIDTLATGLSSERCALYRAGGVFCEEQDGIISEKRRFELCMRPFEGARINDNSLWLSGTTRSRLIYYPEQEKAFADFAALVGERVNVANPHDKIYLAGYNSAATDMPFLMRWYERCGDRRFRDCFHVQALDIMGVAALTLMDRRRAMDSFQMDAAAAELGVTARRGESYSCLDNALTCLDMYVALKRRLGLGDIRRGEPLQEVFINAKA